VVGSNYATGNGEVTLSACGTQVPTGVDAEGRPVLSTGTSFAAPQVAAAAALLKTINPKLSAQDIKDILASTADYEVAQPDGSTVEVPEEMGAGVLRVDKAVLQVINDMRPDDDQLDMDDLIEFATVHLAAEGGPDDYTVTASIVKVGAAGADLTISMSGEGTVTGTTTQHLNGPGAVSWTVTPKEGSTPLIKVHRSDTSACARLTIESPTSPWFPSELSITINMNGTEVPAFVTLTPSGPGGGTAFDGKYTMPYSFSGDTVTYVTPGADETMTYTYTITLTESGGKTTGVGTCVWAGIAYTYHTDGSVYETKPYSFTYDLTAVMIDR
jgi:hypothetical protein